MVRQLFDTARAQVCRIIFTNHHALTTGENWSVSGKSFPPKNVVNHWAPNWQEKQSVIFIDEIDSVCRERSSKEEEHTRRVRNL